MALDIKPFVKWAGGKKQLLNQLIPKIPKQYNTYYEPFIGGGALLFAVQPKHAIINDVNEQLLNVYRHLKQDAEPVIKKVRQLDSRPCDKDFYLQTRARYNEKIAVHELDAECAALMIWINKHCFNGLYRVNSKGLFNVPFNNSKKINSVSPDNLRNIHDYLSSYDIEIKQGDFEEACKDIKAGDFVYFDSAYVPVSATASFTSYTKDGFTAADHQRLADLYRKLDNIGVKVMLSNNNVPEVHELYKGFNIEAFDVHRAINSNASKRSGCEVIITNYTISSEE